MWFADGRPVLRAVAGWVARIRAPLSVKLQVAFLLIAGVLLATGAVSLLAISQIERQAKELYRLEETVTLARTGLDQSIVLQEHLSSMLVLTGDESYLRKLEAEQQRFLATLEKLATQGADAADVARIAVAFDGYRDASAEVVRAKREGHHALAESIHISREHAIAHEIEALTRTVVAHLGDHRQAALTRILRAQGQANWMVGALFMLSITLAILLGRLLARSIVHPIKQVDDALERIAQGEFVVVSEVPNRDEVGSLVTHVDSMSRRLANLYARERQTSQELKEQFESLRRTQKQLIQSEKLRALGEMAGGVAHDFNNLLTVVLGQVDYLQQNTAAAPMSDDTRGRLDIIRTAALDGAHTVRRLLDFTRAVPEQHELQPIDVVDLLATAVAAAQPRWKDEAHAQGRNIEVVTRLAPVPPVTGNAAELREVLLNLIFNALDAMPDGGRLTISNRPGGDDSCLLMVEDTGIGMPEHVASRIFEPFFTTKGPRSSGLGLSVSYGIVRRYGGELTVESRPGRGTTFTVRLPVQHEAPTPSAEPVATATPAGRTLRVLIVDDAPNVRQTLRDIVRLDGHQVWEAASGAAGIALLERQPVDLVCTDLGMPGMTGWQVADRVKSGWPDVKVALITGWGASVSEDKLAEHRVDTLISKPFQAHEIRRMLAELTATADV